MKKQGHEMNWKLERESHRLHNLHSLHSKHNLHSYIIYIVYIFTNKITNIDQSYVNRPKICIDEKESLLCK